MNTLGQRIIYLREHNQITQKTLSNHTGISRSNISKMERDLLKPSAAATVSLAQYFNVTTDWLLLGRQFPPTSAPDAMKVNPTLDEAKRRQLENEALVLLEKLTDESLSTILAFIKFRLYKENQTKAAQ